MRVKKNPEVREIIEQEWTQMFEEQHDNLRRQAKEKNCVNPKRKHET